MFARYDPTESIDVAACASFVAAVCLGLSATDTSRKLRHSCRLRPHAHKKVLEIYTPSVFALVDWLKFCRRCISLSEDIPLSSLRAVIRSAPRSRRPSGLWMSMQTCPYRTCLVSSLVVPVFLSPLFLLVVSLFFWLSFQDHLSPSFSLQHQHKPPSFFSPRS